MPNARVFIGRLPSRASERDVEHFFKGFGKIREVVLKTGFGFVEFSDPRDAEDAVHDMNGRDLCGDRVVVELSNGRGGPRGGGGGGGFGGGDRDRGRGGFGGRGGGASGGGRFGPPVQTRYRMLVENLSSRCSWQDLKDMMRDVGEVAFADAHKKAPNEAIVCFASHDDLRRAMDKFQGKDINGRRIKLIDDTDGGRRRSRSPRGRKDSRSASPRGRKDSRSASPRGGRSRSPRSRSGSRSKSPPGKRSPPSGRSASGSRSPAENGHK